jgi:hypothetical protein
MTQTTASRSLLIIPLILTLVLAFGAIVVKRWRDKNHWTRVTPAQVESDIKQHVPLGSPREQVAAYLNREKIAHYYYGEDLYKGTPYYNCEVALVPHTASSGLITTDIQIIFKFDNAMKLVSYSARETNKGP